MKGKEAARSANRRTAEVAATADELRERLRRQESTYQRRIVELESEVRTLRNEHRAEASRIATAEVRRRMAQVEEERRQRGLSDDITINLCYQKDKFIMNACRYLSMTLGKPPRMVLPLVMTWCTDEDFFGFTGVDRLLKIGVAVDGWLARQLKANKHYERIWRAENVANGQAEAMTLDRAEREGHKDIHPGYKPSWYPRFEHPEIELTDDPEKADPKYRRWPAPEVSA